MLSVLTHDVIVLLAALGFAGQVTTAIFVLFGVLEVFRVGGPFRALREGVAGYELWLAFVLRLLRREGPLLL